MVVESANPLMKMKVTKVEGVNLMGFSLQEEEEEEDGPVRRDFN